ncbi:MAG: hypothetical protein LBS79_09185 [Tannerella sp.]|jgi:uncharacterized lipoprotein YehR (DUF1307 family)|nr:hypothetical protein [Tannerella sp.]
MSDLIGLLMVLLICGCDDLFETHPYSGKISGKTDVNAKNTARIENSCTAPFGTIR